MEGASCAARGLIYHTNLYGTFETGLSFERKRLEDSLAFVPFAVLESAAWRAD